MLEALRPAEPGTVAEMPAVSSSEEKNLFPGNFKKEGAVPGAVVATQSFGDFLEAGKSKFDSF